LPELPEVETTRRGLAPHLDGRIIRAVTVRDRRLRWPIPEALETELIGQGIQAIDRRAKYLLLRLERGTLIVHLGMSGSLRLAAGSVLPEPYDHFELALDSGLVLRLRDPRRFGSVHWTQDDPLRHWLLAELGPEPLGAAFNGAYLHTRSRGRTVAVKDFLMNTRIVAGIGNIYANEALFRAGIHPYRAAGRIARPRYDTLAESVRAVLQEAIAAGGTTLRDFVSGSGEPGYFQVRLDAYGRAGRPCPVCATAIRLARRGQRATYFCPRCQR
jgi:formamidopyrimidine-DNA glycosylase